MGREPDWGGCGNALRALRGQKVLFIVGATNKRAPSDLGYLKWPLGTHPPRRLVEIDSRVIGGKLVFGIQLIYRDLRTNVGY